jgi:hypothetical protein
VTLADSVVAVAFGLVWYGVHTAVSSVRAAVSTVMQVVSHGEGSALPDSPVRIVAVSEDGSQNTAAESGPPRIVKGG